MATRYAVGVTGTVTWTTSNTAIWATASGGASGASAPTSADDVIVDGNSGSGTLNLTTVGASFRSIDFLGFTGTFSYSNPLTISGGTIFRLSSTMTFLGTTLTLSPSFGTTMLVTFAGGSIAGLTLGGSGTVRLQDALSCSGLGQSIGTFDSQSFAITCSSFTSSNSSTRTLTLGSSTITVTGTGSSAWNTTTTTNLTVTANTATVVLTGASGGFVGAINWNGMSLVLSGSGSQTWNSSSGTLANVTRTGTAAKTDTFALAGDLTVTGTLTLNTNSSVNRLLVQSTVVGTARTITAAAVVISNTVDFTDITGAGAATWTAAGTGATYLGDAGGNSGITFTSGATQYRVGSSGTPTAYSDATMWASTSGGSGGTGRVPLPQDDVVLDNNTPTGSPWNISITWDMPRIGRNIDWTAYTRGGTVNGPTSISTLVYGSWQQGSLVFNSSVSVGVTFAGRGVQTLKLNNTMSSVSIASPGGSYTLQGAMTLSSAGNFAVNAGSFVANGFSVTAATVASTGTTTRSIDMGSGTWTLLSVSTATVWNVASTGLTLTASAATVVISVTSANTRTFAGGGFTYGTLTYTVAGSTGGLVLTGANTFGTINFSDATNARTLTLPSSTTTTVTTAFNVNGTAGKLMSVVSSTGGTQATLSYTGADVVNVDYVSVQDINGTPANTWYAGTNSTNVSGNTGWTFTAGARATTLLSLAMAVTTAARAASTASLSLTATSTTSTSATSTGALALAATGTPQVPAVTGGGLEMVAAVTAAAAVMSVSSVTLTAGSAASASPSPTGTLILIVAGDAGATTSSAASVTLTATSTVSAPLSSAGALDLFVAAAAAAAAAPIGMLNLIAAGTVGASLATVGTIDLVIAATAAPPSSTTTLQLLAAGAGGAAASSSGALTLIVSGTTQAAVGAVIGNLVLATSMFTAAPARSLASLALTAALTARASLSSAAPLTLAVGGTGATPGSTSPALTLQAAVLALAPASGIIGSLDLATVALARMFRDITMVLGSAFVLDFTSSSVGGAGLGTTPSTSGLLLGQPTI